eukprot:TRINITY_DN23421_c0_g2_i1.p1 TRINITY_DN23421_c0_g2~~TRINITY_DN23421_c0_g2_i1.p1  ORF type:complete len:761 (-),score=120.10 TRINITY_DN23421_c0_g2_i1:212-2494(-)
MPNAKGPSKAAAFASKTVVQLREECRSRGLKVSGKKDEIISRLKAYERKAAAAARRSSAESANPAASAHQALGQTEVAEPVVSHTTLPTRDVESTETATAVNVPEKTDDTAPLLSEATLEITAVANDSQMDSSNVVSLGMPESTSEPTKVEASTSERQCPASTSAELCTPKLDSATAPSIGEEKRLVGDRRALEAMLMCRPSPARSRFHSVLESSGAAELGSASQVAEFDSSTSLERAEVSRSNESTACANTETGCRDDESPQQLQMLPQDKGEAAGREHAIKETVHMEDIVMEESAVAAPNPDSPSVEANDDIRDEPALSSSSHDGGVDTEQSIEALQLDERAHTAEVDFAKDERLQSSDCGSDALSAETSEVQCSSTEVQQMTPAADAVDAVLQTNAATSASFVCEGSSEQTCLTEEAGPSHLEGVTSSTAASEERQPVVVGENVCHGLPDLASPARSRSPRKVGCQIEKEPQPLVTGGVNSLEERMKEKAPVVRERSRSPLCMQRSPIEPPRKCELAAVTPTRASPAIVEEPRVGPASIGLKKLPARSGSASSAPVRAGDSASAISTKGGGAAMEPPASPMAKKGLAAQVARLQAQADARARGEALPVQTGWEPRASPLRKTSHFSWSPSAAERTQQSPRSALAVSTPPRARPVASASPAASAREPCGSPMSSPRSVPNSPADNKNRLLGQLTENMQRCLARLTDRDLDDHSREKYRLLAVSIQGQMDKLSSLRSPGRPCSPAPSVGSPAFLRRGGR